MIGVYVRKKENFGVRILFYFLKVNSDWGIWNYSIVYCSFVLIGFNLIKCERIL